jgi:HEAT repeat protein
VHADAFGWHGFLNHTGWDAYAADEDPLVRAAIARTSGLDRKGAMDPNALLADDDLRVRRRALWSLALRDPTAAKGHARGDANTDDPDDFSLRVLGFVGSSRDVGILARHVERRAAAARALGDLGDPAALDVLLRAFDAEDPNLVAGAMDGALAIVGPPPPTDAETEELDPAQVRELVEEKRRALHPGERFVRGAPFAAEANPDEDVTELLWKRAVLVPNPSMDAWRREVPDGFFDAVPLTIAVSGESRWSCATRHRFCSVSSWTSTATAPSTWSSP